MVEVCVASVHPKVSGRGHQGQLLQGQPLESFGPHAVLFRTQLTRPPVSDFRSWAHLEVKPMWQDKGPPRRLTGTNTALLDGRSAK